ncbi:hypothetical protein B6A14_10145 [Polynucleobacter hirudinilacicola]|uniref:Uncharacterized protein n=1 Tax=Polynucleobacter hirudinilacicola TaxID=1743166 RepID=A0A210RVE1_9BURK|nr:hypothetical protein [Polynucleobacter hirudinilacicola]OWF64963.1 hypothetical protein B6A14_10145 [Polynucleobacter hirudinilacicola]
MYRIIVLLIISLGLIACKSNDRVVSAWEINDVYRSTIISSNPSNGAKIYQGPPINTMDDANTFEMFSLRGEKSTQGAKSYELLVHLTYFAPWRYYESANLLNKPASTFKVVSREAGICDAQGCVFKELMSIQVTDTFLREQMDKGFQVTISSKTGVSSNLFVPAQYLKGYLQAVDGPKN